MSATGLGSSPVTDGRSTSNRAWAEPLPAIGVRIAEETMSWQAAHPRTEATTRRVRGTLAIVLLSAITVLSGCRAQIATAHPAGSISYDHRASAVVIEFQLLPPYNPDAQATGWSLTVHGDGTVVYAGRTTGPGKISGARLQAVLQQMWDDGLFAGPNLGERTYDAGEERLVATVNSTRTDLIVSSMSPRDNPSVAATRAAIKALLQATR